MTLPRAGQVIMIGERASVQFAGDRRLIMRVISIDPRPTYDGWAWITGYVLDERGDAREKREVFVQKAGLRLLGATPRARKRQFDVTRV